MRNNPIAGALFAGIAAMCTPFNSLADEVSRASTSPEPLLAAARTNTEATMNVYLTGYSYWDNTPPGSAAIAKPVVHRRAGGSGSYKDPITIAVGHSINGSRRSMDFPAGTRFYIERLRKYGVVEDVCGDGPKPQNGPCHSGYRGNPWIDIYVGGKSAGRSVSNTCMNRLTGVQRIIINPKPGYPVEKGALAESGCRVF